MVASYEDWTTYLLEILQVLWQRGRRWWKCHLRIIVGILAPTDSHFMRIKEPHILHILRSKRGRVSRSISGDKEVGVVVIGYFEREVDTEVSNQSETCDNCYGATNEGFPRWPFDPTLLIGYVDHIAFRIW